MLNSSSLTTMQIRQGPFARPALPGVLTTMDPSDSPRSQKTVIGSRRLLANRHVSPVSLLRGVSQVPRLVFRRPPSPTTPESPTAASARYFTAGVRLHHLWESGHSLKRHEAEPGSLALRLTSSSQRASIRGSPRASPFRLHAERAIRMVGSFHPTRPARLNLTHQSPQREE
jgi:hypothetical protein